MAGEQQPAHTSNRQTLRHIPELDGVRGLAAVIVFFHHACFSMLHPEWQSGWPPLIVALSNIFHYGNTGVDLFFVLSGFLITTILINEKRSPRYYQDFYWKRALRILPLYILVLGIALVTLHQYGYVLLSLLFIVNFAAPLHVTSDGPFWTLAIEEQFYLLWPTVVRRLNISQIRRWSLTLGFLSIFLRFALALAGHHNYDLSPLRCDGLAFGAFLACHFVAAGNDLQARLSLNSSLWAIAAIGVVCIATSQLAVLQRLSPPLFQTGVVFVTGSIIGLCIAHTGSTILAPLRSRILTFFGLISYAFYMMHMYLIMLYDHFLGPLRGGNLSGYWVRLAVTFLATVAASLLSRYLVELPALRLRKHVLKHPNLHAEQANPPLPLARM